jgi:hypothetical protein
VKVENLKYAGGRHCSDHSCHTCGVGLGFAVGTLITERLPARGACAAERARDRHHIHPEGLVVELGAIIPTAYRG